MDHLRTNPQPSSSVWQFVMRPIRVYFKAQHVAIESKRAFQVFTQKCYVVNPMEQDSACTDDKGGQKGRGELGNPTTHVKQHLHHQ